MRRPARRVPPPPRHAGTRTGRARGLLARVAPSLLSVTAFTCITVAAFQLDPAAGWAAAGLSLLTLEWLIRG